nr:22K protein [Siadenovirus sp.]
MLSFFHSPLKENTQSTQTTEEQPKEKKRKKRRIPGSYAKWKQYCNDVKEAIAVVGRQPVSVRRYLLAKGINIPSSTVNYYVNKYLEEGCSKFTLF